MTLEYTFTANALACPHSCDRHSVTLPSLLAHFPVRVHFDKPISHPPFSPSCFYRPLRITYDFFCITSAYAKTKYGYPILSAVIIRTVTFVILPLANLWWYRLLYTLTLTRVQLILLGLRGVCGGTATVCALHALNVLYVIATITLFYTFLAITSVLAAIFPNDPFTLATPVPPSTTPLCYAAFNEPVCQIVPTTHHDLPEVLPIANLRHPLAAIDRTIMFGSS